MRILLVNPNMTARMTDGMAAIAGRVAGDRAEIVPVTAKRGFPYIASRAEAQIAGGIALEMIAEHLGEIDAVIIAAFGDPGLVAAREIFDLPVVGMAEASFMTAAMLGERFSVVTFSSLMTPWYNDCIEASGLGARCTGVRTPAARDVDVASVARDKSACLVSLARDAALTDRADAIILAGAPLAGLAGEIADKIPALVIEPIAAATAQAMALASIMRPAAFALRGKKPAGKASVGLPSSLASIMAGNSA